MTGGLYGQVRVRKDYSYTTTRFWRPGFFLVGDAACFVDPVFSTGVHLATYSALLAARSVNSCLSGELAEERCFDEFEKRYRREYGIIYDFLLTFYDMHSDEESYFWSARKVLRTEERNNEAFVRLVGGGTTTTHDFFQARLHLVEDSERLSAFFKERELGGQELEAQVSLGPDRPLEQPLFKGGLVPSRDALHWSVPTSAQLRREDVLCVAHPLSYEVLIAKSRRALRVQYDGRAIALSENALPLIESLAQRHEFVAADAIGWVRPGSMCDWPSVEAALLLLLREGVISLQA